MKRRTFIERTALASLGLMTGTLSSLARAASDWPTTPTMPVVFIGHGAPTYVLGDNAYNRAWRKLGQNLPTPKAVVSISAHWLTPGETKVTAMPKPRTIHDFGGFPQEMYEIEYPAAGSPQLAQWMAEQFDGPTVGLDHEWGLDHGTWTVLYHMFPEANIPVIQLSIDYSKPGQWHYDLAKQLQSLRNKGVLIFGSGNIVHNLRRIQWTESAAYDWAREFDEQSAMLMNERNHKALINWQDLGTAAQLSIPTPDHYYPLLYTLGLQSANDEVSYPVEGLAYGSTSMRSVLLTAKS